MIEAGRSNEVYFRRNRGEWRWSVRFEILNWRAFLALPLPLFRKAMLAGFVLSPKALGDFSGKTCVTLDLANRQVHHLTEIRKFGLCLYRSRKVISLHENGTGLALSGHEYFWPLLYKGIPFPSQNGLVQEDTVTGVYQMPLMGIPCHCEVTMSPKLGEIRVEEPWIRGSFVLDDDSLARLRSRFATGPE